MAWGPTSSGERHVKGKEAKRLGPHMGDPLPNAALLGSDAGTDYDDSQTFDLFNASSPHEGPPLPLDDPNKVVQGQALSKMATSSPSMGGGGLRDYGRKQQTSGGAMSDEVSMETSGVPSDSEEVYPPVDLPFSGEQYLRNLAGYKDYDASELRDVDFTTGNYVGAEPMEGAPPTDLAAGGAEKARREGMLRQKSLASLANVGQTMAPGVMGGAESESYNMQAPPPPSMGGGARDLLRAQLESRQPPEAETFLGGQSSMGNFPTTAMVSPSPGDLGQRPEVSLQTPGMGGEPTPSMIALGQPSIGGPMGGGGGGPSGPMLDEADLEDPEMNQQFQEFMRMASAAGIPGPQAMEMFLQDPFNAAEDVAQRQGISVEAALRLMQRQGR